MDAQGLRWIGVSEDQIAQAVAADQARQHEAAEPYGIWAENWATWQLFLGLSTRWQYLRLTMAAPMGGAVNRLVRQGLPRPEIESAARMAGVPRRQWPELLADLQAMEQAVLEADRARLAARA